MNPAYRKMVILSIGRERARKMEERRRAKILRHPARNDGYCCSPECCARINKSRPAFILVVKKGKKGKQLGCFCSEECARVYQKKGPLTGSFRDQLRASRGAFQNKKPPRGGKRKRIDRRSWFSLRVLSRDQLRCLPILFQSELRVALVPGRALRLRATHRAASGGTMRNSEISSVTSSANQYTRKLENDKWFEKSR